MARMRQLFAPAIASLIVLLSNSPLRAQEINWRTNFEAARREAQESGRPMLLDFGTHACIYCKQLDAITFRVPTVARMLNDSFIPVHIDAQREQGLTNSMRVHSFPTLIMMDAQGRTIDRREGFIEAGAMMAFLDQGKKVASAGPRPQFRAQSRKDRIPAKVLAIDEPIHRPQSPASKEIVATRPEILHLPTPEELGIGSEKATQANEFRHADWTALHARLERIGATCLQVNHPNAQSVRIQSVIPVAENRVHRIDASAATEAEAVRLFIEQVDEWSAHP